MNSESLALLYLQNIIGTNVAFCLILMHLTTKVCEPLLSHKPSDFTSFDFHFFALKDDTFWYLIALKKF